MTECFTCGVCSVLEGEWAAGVGGTTQSQLGRTVSHTIQEEG